MIGESNEPNMCCPDCKKCGGIEHTKEGTVNCEYCEWTGDPNSLILDDDNFEYHDHEPGID
jgi:hypothetical protein